MGMELKNHRPVGNYMITGFVKGGTFGQVYLGHRKDDPDSPVAIKSVSMSRAKQTEESVKSEVKIMQRLNHPNIVKFHDVLFEKDAISIVMEYCNGQDLHAYISTPDVRKLSSKTISLFFGQLSSALEYLNFFDIIHRDLKPQNILLQIASGQPPDCVEPADIVLKMADFGFARILEEEKMAKTHCGTPIYMAPEILQGRRQYDGRCDLWSLGVMMYQCYYGETPFSATNIASLKAQFAGKVEAVFKGNIPQQLKDLLSRTLKKNPDHRISFADFFSHPFFIPAERATVPSTWSARGAQKPPSSSVAIPRSAPREVSSQASSQGRSRPSQSSGRGIAAQGSYHSPASHNSTNSPASSGHSGHGSSFDDKRFHPSSVDPPSLMPLASLVPQHENPDLVMEDEFDYVMVSRQDQHRASPSSAGQSPQYGSAGYWPHHAQGRFSSPQAVAGSPGSSHSLPRSGGRRTDAVTFPGSHGASPRTASGRHSLEQHNRYSSSPAKQVQQQQQGASSGSSGTRPSPYLVRRNSRASSGSVGDASFPSPFAHRHATAGGSGGASNSPETAPMPVYGSPSRYAYVSPWKVPRMQASLNADNQSWTDNQEQLVSCRELLGRCEKALSHSLAAVAMIDNRSKVFRTMGISAAELKNEPSMIMSVANRLVEVFCLHKKLAIYTGHFLEQIMKEWSLSDRMSPDVIEVSKELYPIFLRSVSRSDELLQLILSQPSIRTDKVSPEQDIFVYMLEKLQTTFSEAKFIGQTSKDRLCREFQQVIILAGYLLDSYNVDNTRPLVTQDMMLYQISIEQMRTYAQEYQSELMK